MNTTYFKSLYILDVDTLETEVADHLVMCGTQNWEHYYDLCPQEAHVETLQDIVLIEFKDKKTFQSFITTNETIDYSLEHENPLVLIHGKD
ncbi:MAG: hypothetical protein PHI38_01290 [Sulfurimonas sp.]|jgi:hypothetical protein|uniref:hypothetical protein n=1 Tax=Sulfurimonas sp. TaxID=2022749 RepID=UPI002639203D|nr:hypothetical protein [Sulfurimonas sp.]MDD3475482.1 hypothetical protein [Sulfurimonas sp.]